MHQYLLAIDQGTTSSRAIVFDKAGRILGQGQEQFPQLFPKDGWVEHNPEDIWNTSLHSCQKALRDAGISGEEVLATGITNQRETTLVWDRATSQPIYNAIVWQDRRTASYCDELIQAGKEPLVHSKTGLLLDPYFSASKLRWILDNIPDAREQACRGELAFGTMDTFLLWRLTGGRSHYTDATNASRTLLYNIHDGKWDEELLSLFDIPASLLPEVKDCAADFGVIDKEFLGAQIPVCGIAGDQQAAAFGQCCFAPGMAKSTYGTGCFLLLNTGDRVLKSDNKLLSTIAYSLDGTTSYAVEGSIFMAGATIQWIRDKLQLIESSAESETLAQQVPDDLSVYMVPAFTGLGAPYWDPNARGAIFGMTRDTGIPEIVTAALLSVCYQTRDLVQALLADGASIETIRVDGGMVANNFLLQNLADLLGVSIQRPEVIETTALGVAYLAGLQVGVYDSLADINSNWQVDASFKPCRDELWRNARYKGWLDAVKRTRSGGQK